LAPGEVTKRRSKRRRTSSGDGGPSSPAWSSGASGSESRSCDRGVWCGVRVNPNHSTVPASFIPLCPKPYRCMGFAGCMGRRQGRSLERGLRRVLMRARPESCSGPGFKIQGNRPTTISSIFISCIYLVLQFKFSLILNVNLVSIPSKLCNPIENLCNIVMINFMFRL
jgi:hypothetical protein